MLNSAPPQRVVDNDSFDDAPEIKQIKTVKLNNDNSKINNQQPLPNIRENIDKILANEQEQMKVAFQLTGKLLSIIKDKVLDENKTLVEREAERKVFSEYSDFARIMNSDEKKQEDGLGTLSFIMALSRCILLQRDRINEMEYQVVKFGKELEKTNSEIRALKAKEPAKQ